MDQREEELSAAIEELTATLRELRAELDDPPRGPFGLPRPPTPGELLRFTEQYTIPTLIALFESAIRTLELLAAAIRLADGRPLGTDRTSRLADTSRATLRTLDEALVDLQNAVEGGEPSNPELRRMLEQARELRTEVDERLAAATAEHEDTSESTTVPVDRSDEATDDGVDVNVDAELESIRREVDGTDDSTQQGGSDTDDETP